MSTADKPRPVEGIVGRSADLSIGRDLDGEPNIDVHLDGDNTISLSVSPTGLVSWAGSCDGVRARGNFDAPILLYQLLHKIAEPV